MNKIEDQKHESAATAHARLCKRNSTYSLRAEAIRDAALHQATLQRGVGVELVDDASGALRGDAKRRRGQVFTD
eukprot:4177502-Pleurochrysis_carterae.AAC.1